MGGAPTGGVRAVADGGVGEELTGRGVDDGHLLAVADREEAMAGGVEGKAGGGIAAGGPGAEDSFGAGVDADDFALVFEVVENCALAIGDSKLRLAGEGDGGDDSVRDGVDDGDRLGAAVEGPDGLRGGLEDDAIGVGSGGDGGDDGEGRPVEGDDCVAAAIGDVAELAGGVERNAVDAVEAGDGANRFTGGGVDDVDLRAVGEVEAMRAGIGDEIVPSAFAADFPVVDDVVGLL